MAANTLGFSCRDVAYLHSRQSRLRLVCSLRHASDYLVFVAAFILPFLEAYVYVSRIAPLNKKLGELWGGGDCSLVPFLFSTFLLPFPSFAPLLAHGRGFHP